MNSVSVDTLPPWPSVQQTAAYLGVAEKTIRRWAASGRLTIRRVGPRLLRVDRRSILAMTDAP